MQAAVHRLSAAGPSDTAVLDDAIAHGLIRPENAVALKPRCEENRVIMGLYHLPATQPAWTRREPGGAHENPETIIRPTALDLST